MWVFYSNVTHGAGGQAKFVKSVRVRTRRDLSQIVNISADFLGNICAAYCLQILAGLSSFYLGFAFFSDIKGTSIFNIGHKSIYCRDID